MSGKYCGFTLDAMLLFLSRYCTSVSLTKDGDDFRIHVLSDEFGEFEKKGTIFSITVQAFHPFMERAKQSRRESQKRMEEITGRSFFPEEDMQPLAKAALDLYKPPFSYRWGYIHDGEGRTFSDSGETADALKNMIVSRIRGWGRLSYIEGEFKPEDLQDAVGEHVAIALNEYWEKHNGNNIH